MLKFLFVLPLSFKEIEGKIRETLWTRTQKADRETGAADNK